MSKQDLQDELEDLVLAGVSGIWIETSDNATVLEAVTELSRDKGWQQCAWDMDSCFQVYTIARGGFGWPTREGVDKKEVVPVYLRELPEALKAFREQAEKRSVDTSKHLTPPILFLITNPQLTPSHTLGLAIQMMENQCVEGREQHKHLVVISTQTKIPPELEKQFILIEHPLPLREELLELLTEKLGVEEDRLPADGEETERVLSAAMGMTALEAENAMSLSAVREDMIKPDVIWEIKAQTLRKSAGLSLWNGKESFATLGGLDSLKSFCLRAIQNASPDDPLKRPKGLLLLGVPGSGKSALAKALGHETSRPTICLDVGALMGSFVGQTEGNTRQALRVVDAMAPCILMIDEVEKFLAGAGSSSDSGVTARLFGTFLTWLNDHTSDVFTICTCNDISRLPPEFSRAERFDGVFFVDLPTEEERQAIWSIYLEMYDLCGKLSPVEYMERSELPDDDQWTGAEIRACCRLAALMKIPLAEAAGNVIPIATMSAAVIGELREWAQGRCLAASYPGRYRGPLGRGEKPSNGQGKVRRKVSRKQRKQGPEN